MQSSSHANQKRRRQFIYLALFSLLLHLLIALIIFQHAFKRQARSLIQALHTALSPAEQTQLAETRAARKEAFNAVFAELKTKEDPIIAALTARDSQTVWMDIDPTALEQVSLEDVAKPIDTNPGFTSAHEQAGEMIAATDAAAPEIPEATLRHAQGECIKSSESKAQDAVESKKQDALQAAADGSAIQEHADGYPLDAHLPEVALPEQRADGAHTGTANNQIATITHQQEAGSPQQEQVASAEQSAMAEPRPPSKLGLGKGRTLLALTNQFLKGFGRAGGTGTDFTDRAGSTSITATTADLEASLYREKINACWVAAFNQAESYKALRRKLWDDKVSYRNAVINYTINKAGKLITASLEQSTGNQNLDAMIMHAIKAVARFPAAPKHFTQETYSYTELIKADHLDGSESCLVLRKG
jgi:TonB family protein